MQTTPFSPWQAPILTQIPAESAETSIKGGANTDGFGGTFGAS